MKAASSLIMAAVVGAVCVACGGTTALEDEAPGQPPSVLQAEESWDDDSISDATEGVSSSNGIVITRTRSPGNQCGTRTCFHLKADKNISHVFLDFGECEVKHFKVLARTPFTGTFEDVTDRLKTHGGPCKELDMAYRFELRGPDRDDNDDPREADVCVVFNDKISAVRIGAKAGSTCEAASFLQANWGDCRKCQKKH